MLIAAEILQFGNGKCHARTSHFQSRFGFSKNTVLDAVRDLKDAGILTENGPIKTVSLVISGSSIIDQNVQKLNPKGGSEIEPTVQKLNPKVQKLDRDLNIEVNTEDKKEEINSTMSCREWSDLKRKNFEAIWKDHPKKTEKPDAFEQFSKLIGPKQDLVKLGFFCKIFRHYSKLASAQIERDGNDQYVCAVGRWLKRQDFSDEPWRAFWEESERDLAEFEAGLEDEQEPPTQDASNGH